MLLHLVEHRRLNFLTFITASLVSYLLLRIISSGLLPQTLICGAREIPYGIQTLGYTMSGGTGPPVCPFIMGSSPVGIETEGAIA